MHTTTNRARRRLAVSLCLSIIMGGLLGGLAAGCTSAGDATTSVRSSDTTSAQTASSGAPSGAPGEAPGAAPGDSSSVVDPTEAVYAQSGDAKTEDGRDYSASEDDQSGILVSDDGSLTVSNATVETRGDTSSDESSSIYGLNAAVVATKGSSITMSDSSITTTGSGANGAFATGEGTSITLTDVTIEATGEGGHGVAATQGGSVILEGVKITTAGAQSAPLATNRGGGTITATSGSALCSGQDSPALYSTGLLTINGGTYQATGAEAAVVEGSGSIVLTDVHLSSTFADKWGVLLYQRMSRDDGGAGSAFTMTGGSLSVIGESSPLFYVTNSTGVIILEKGVDITCESGVLVNAAAGNWGAGGSNGGAAALTAIGQILRGDLKADSSSSLSIRLTSRSILTGAINADNAAKRVDLTLGSNSTFIVTADSYLTSLTLGGGVTGTAITSIVGNGHTVYYDAADSANSPLGGQTYTLSGGGTLRPLS